MRRKANQRRMHAIVFLKLQLGIVAFIDVIISGLSIIQSQN
jgi:hypothetical protein